MGRSSKGPQEPSWAKVLPPENQSHTKPRILLHGWQHPKGAKDGFQATVVRAKDQEHCIRSSRSCPFHLDVGVNTTQPSMTLSRLPCDLRQAEANFLLVSPPVKSPPTPNHLALWEQNSLSGPHRN